MRRLALLLALPGAAHALDFVYVCKVPIHVVPGLPPAITAQVECVPQASAPAPASSQPQVVQVAGVSFPNATLLNSGQLAVPLPKPTAAGSTLVVVYGTGDALVDLSALQATDNGGNTLEGLPAYQVTNGFRQRVFVAKNTKPTGMANSVVFTRAGAADRWPDVRVIEIAGLDPNAPVSNVNNVAGPTQIITASTPAVPGLVLAVGMHACGQVPRPAVHLDTVGFNTALTTPHGGWLAIKDVASSQVQAFQASLPAPCGWLVQTLALKAK